MRKPEKKKQHHVAQMYLRAWAENDQLQALVNGSHKPISIRDAASQNRFYAARPLTRLDIDYIRLWIDLSPKWARKVHETSFKMLSTWSMLHEWTLENQPENQPLLDHLKYEMRNFEEEYHAKLESRNAPVIEALRRGDSSPYDDDSTAAHFLNFLALQLLRTKAVKDQSIGKIVPYLDNLHPDDPMRNFDPANSWNVVTHILAANIGGTLYVERRQRRLIVVQSVGDVEFITGDKPVLNLRGKVPDAYVAYYPLSPSKALILTDTDGKNPYSDTVLTDEEIDELNRKILGAAHIQAFARTRAMLTRYDSPAS